MSGLIGRILQGERLAISKAISLIENTLPEKRLEARDLLCGLLKASKAAPPKMRIGISGPPGVGKSTFIDALGNHLLVGLGKSVAVLAVDPSSSLTGGSLLGDKTRMPRLSTHPRAFVRPSPAAGSLGGVTRTTAEALCVVEAGGADVTIVETVGVGQSETAVEGLVDTFVLLCSPGGGDELQGLKKGVVELADVIVVNKTDGDTVAIAQRTRNEYAGAIRLIHCKNSAWKPPVLNCSARAEKGVAEVWQAIVDHHNCLVSTGQLEQRRSLQRVQHMWGDVHCQLLDLIHRDPDLNRLSRAVEDSVVHLEMTSGEAADRIMASFHQSTARLPQDSRTREQQS